MNTYTCLGGPLHGQEISVETSRFVAFIQTPASCVAMPDLPLPIAGSMHEVEYQLTDGFWMIDPAHYLVANRVGWAVEHHAKHHARWHAIEMGWLDYLAAGQDGQLEQNIRGAKMGGLPVIVRDDLQYHLKLI